MSEEFTISEFKRVASERVLDRFFVVSHAPTGRKLFSLLAYGGNCCGISIVGGVTDYAQPGQLLKALQWLGNAPQQIREDNLLSWELKSFIYFGGPQEHYKAKAASMGMKEMCRWPSRSEPGHDVVQYFVDFGLLPEGK